MKENAEKNIGYDDYYNQNMNVFTFFVSLKLSFLMWRVATANITTRNNSTPEYSPPAANHTPDVVHLTEAT